MRSVLPLLMLLLSATSIHSQRSNQFEIKPAVGMAILNIKPSVSVVINYPVANRWSVASYSMLSFLPANHRKQQYVQTNYNYSLIQNFGIGYTLYSKNRNSRHTLSVLGGIKRIAFSETLKNPQLDEITTVTRSTLPEYGLLYEIALGKKRLKPYGRIYLPLHPIQYYPMGTLDNIALLELGVSISGYRKK